MKPNARLICLIGMQTVKFSSFWQTFALGIVFSISPSANITEYFKLGCTSLTSDQSVKAVGLDEGCTVKFAEGVMILKTPTANITGYFTLRYQSFGVLAVIVK
jgi:hypothetical protein